MLKNEIKEMDKLFNSLFPILRSITGDGLRKTLEILNEYIPLEFLEYKSGQRVLNWEIPEEWKIREAWIKDSTGNKIVDLTNNNLHIVNYSQAVDKKLKLNELKKHLYTSPKMPEAIPYVTSYYKKRWGFCMSQKQYDLLEEGKYHVYIDSNHFDGQMDLGHAVLPGKSDKEILISSYICHPSLANNELSGPIVAAFLYHRIKNWENRRFTYRFVFAPETIGTIAYLSTFGEELKEKLYSGIVLTCLGGDSNLSYKLSRRENSIIDKIVNYLFSSNIIEGETRNFTPVFGSNERQYCSPGFNLPVGQIARKVYGYSEYHTSADNKEFMGINNLYQSLNEIELILKSQEINGYYLNQFPYGEVKLDKHDLYPDLNSRDGMNFKNKRITNWNDLRKVQLLLNYSDGQMTLLDLAKKFNLEIIDLKDIIDILKSKGLLKGPYFKEEVNPLWM